MIFLFGTKDKSSVVGKGTFYCPHCQTERAYERKRAKRYFTAYFIPVFPVSDLGEFIECQTCGMTYTLDVLDAAKPKRKRRTLAEMINNLPAILDEGMPIEYLLADLTAAGLEREAALRLIRDALGKARAACPNCGLTYAPAIDICPECQHPLETHE